MRQALGTTERKKMKGRGEEKKREESCSKNKKKLKGQSKDDLKDVTFPIRRYGLDGNLSDPDLS